jgi:hypothetical protein
LAGLEGSVSTVPEWLVLPIPATPAQHFDRSNHPLAISTEPPASEIRQVP